MNIDQVIAEIEAIQLAEGKLLLPNPYSPENNAAIFIAKGFGVTVGSGSIGEGASYKQPFYMVNRPIGLVFTSDIIGNPQDSGVIKSNEQRIRQEAFDLFAKIYHNKTIGELVTSLNFDSDELQFFGGDEGFSHIAFTLNVNFLIKETV